MSAERFLNGERASELWERTKEEIKTRLPDTATDEEVAEMLEDVFGPPHD